MTALASRANAHAGSRVTTIVATVRLVHMTTSTPATLPWQCWAQKAFHVTVAEGRGSGPQWASDLEGRMPTDVLLLAIDVDDERRAAPARRGNEIEGADEHVASRRRRAGSHHHHRSAE